MRDSFIFYIQCLERVRLIGVCFKPGAKIYDIKEARIGYDVIPVNFG